MASGRMVWSCCWPLMASAIVSRASGTSNMNGIPDGDGGSPTHMQQGGGSPCKPARQQDGGGGETYVKLSPNDISPSCEGLSNISPHNGQPLAQKQSGGAIANGCEMGATAPGGRILFCAQSFEELFQDKNFLQRLFTYLTPVERCGLAPVCKCWKDVLYQPMFWKTVTPILHRRDLYEEQDDGTKNFTSLASFELRGFESVCLVSVSDLDICEFIDHCPRTKKSLRAISLKRSTVTDAGLEVMLEQLGSVTSLELSGCNDFTEAGLWASLQPRLTSLSISDCINVADESVAAIAQRLPQLRELNLQAYHVTDAVLGCLVAQRCGTLTTLRLKSCWELTNQAVVNLIHCLPQLTTLSLSGCSKITDEAIELVAENLGQLRCLDLSWCPRITDAALEYIACDLPKLEELTLDR